MDVFAAILRARPRGLDSRLSPRRQRTAPSPGDAAGPWVAPRIVVFHRVHCAAAAASQSLASPLPDLTSQDMRVVCACGQRPGAWRGDLRADEPIGLGEAARGADAG